MFKKFLERFNEFLTLASKGANYANVIHSNGGDIYISYPM